MELPHKNTLNLSTMIQSHCVLSFFWNSLSGSDVHHLNLNKTNWKSSLVSFQSFQTLTIEHTMDLQKGYGCEVSWVMTNEFNSGGSTFSPPSQPPCQQQSQQKPNRNQQQQHQLHQTFWMICLLESTVSRITLICIFSNKAKSSVLNKLCLVCSILPQKVESSLRSSSDNFLQSSVSVFVVYVFISIWKRHRPWKSK